MVLTENCPEVYTMKEDEDGYTQKSQLKIHIIKRIGKSTGRKLLKEMIGITIRFIAKGITFKFGSMEVRQLI